MNYFELDRSNFELNRTQVRPPNHQNQTSNPFKPLHNIPNPVSARNRPKPGLNPEKQNIEPFQTQICINIFQNWTTNSPKIPNLRIWFDPTLFSSTLEFWRENLIFIIHLFFFEIFHEIKKYNNIDTIEDNIEIGTDVEIAPLHKCPWQKHTCPWTSPNPATEIWKKKYFFKKMLKHIS